MHDSILGDCSDHRSDGKQSSDSQLEQRDNRTMNPASSIRANAGESSSAHSVIGLYAHSLRDRPIREWQPLEAHLAQVAESSARFAQSFSSADWAWNAGLLHDIGKAVDGFLAYPRREYQRDDPKYDFEELDLIVPKLATEFKQRIRDHYAVTGSKQPDSTRPILASNCCLVDFDLNARDRIEYAECARCTGVLAITRGRWGDGVLCAQFGWKAA